MDRTYTFDPDRPPAVSAEAWARYGYCVVCDKPIFTSFVRLHVARDARRTYVARAHTSCYALWRRGVGDGLGV